MAFQETLDLIAEQKASLIATRSSLLEARAARDRLTDDIVNARRRLERKRTSQTFPTNLAKGIIRDMKKQSIMTAILIGEIDNAILTNEEFGRDEYKTALYNVAGKQDIYKVIPQGTGWNLNITVVISFEEEGGLLNDWAKGISAYRDQIGTVIGEEDSDRGFRATNFWYDKVYRTQLETKTVKSRLALSGRKAPFWQILNSGSQPLASDRPDSSYNPVPATPTDFIGDAQRAIRAEFREYFYPERDKWFEEANKLEKEIADAVKTRDGFTQDIRKLRPEVKLNQAILQSLGKRADYADEKKLAKAIAKYRAGEEFETSQINLTKAGSKRKVTLSVKKLEGFIDYL